MACLQRMSDPAAACLCSQPALPANREIVHFQIPNIAGRRLLDAAGEVGLLTLLKHGQGNLRGR